jgi:hypothetical protein
MSWRRSPGRGTGASTGTTAGASPGPGSASEVRMTFLPPLEDAARVSCFLADHLRWSSRLGLRVRKRLRVQGAAVPTSVPIRIQDGYTRIGVGTREELSAPAESGLPATFTFAEAVAGQVPDDGLVGAVVSASCLSRRVSAA